MGIIDFKDYGVVDNFLEKNKKNEEVKSKIIYHVDD